MCIRDRYNGYKVYWEDGAQFTDPHASGVTAKVNAITDISTCKTMSKEDAVTAGLYEVIGKEVDDAYIKMCIRDRFESHTYTNDFSVWSCHFNCLF